MFVHTWNFNWNNVKIIENKKWSLANPIYHINILTQSYPSPFNYNVSMLSIMLIMSTILPHAPINMNSHYLDTWYHRVCINTNFFYLNLQLLIWYFGVLSWFASPSSPFIISNLATIIYGSSSSILLFLTFQILLISFKILCFIVFSLFVSFNVQQCAPILLSYYFVHL